MSIAITCLILNKDDEAHVNETKLWNVIQETGRPWVEQGTIALSMAPSATEAGLRSALANGCEVLHLLVSVIQHPNAHYAAVALRSSGGQIRELTAQAFGRLLTGYSSLKLVVVQAVNKDSRSLCSFGDLLTEMGVPAVITTVCFRNQLQIRFLAALYCGLSDSEPIGEIVRTFRGSLDESEFDSEPVSLSRRQLGSSGSIDSRGEVGSSRLSPGSVAEAKSKNGALNHSPPTLFFSYSHRDELLRDELEVQLSSLKRQNLISSWHDRRIMAGDHFEKAIDEKLEEAQVILLLVSSDFIASDYCYEKEMARALERHTRLEAWVLPVILRPCDWHELPFGQLLAAPKDGKPITSWPDRDEAFVDVVRSIKNVLKRISVLK